MHNCNWSTTSEIGRNYLSQAAKEKGSIFGFVDEKLENKTGLHQTTDLKTTQSSNLLNLQWEVRVDTNSAFTHA